MDPPENLEYTVKKTAKIHLEKREDPRPSIWQAVVKWIVAIFLFLSVLACVVASKISLLSIAHFRGNGTNVQPKNPKKNPVSVFIMMVLVLMIPEGFILLKACWTSLFRGSHKWPSKKAVLVGLIAGVLEVFGLCFLTVVVLLGTDLSIVFKLVMMNGVFIIPVCWELYKLFSRSEYSSKEISIFIFALLLEVAGIAILMFKVKETQTVTIVVGIALSLLAISISWCPKVVTIAMEPAGFLNSNSGQDELHLSFSLNSKLTTEVENRGSTVSQMPPGKTARGKATIILSFWKLLLTPFVAAMFCHFFDVAVLENNSLQIGFDDLELDHQAFPHFMAQIFASLIGYLWGILACSICMQQPAFLLPLFLATPISVGIALVPNFTSNDTIPFHHGDYTDPFVYAVLLCLFLAQFLSVGYVFSEQLLIMAKESTLFWMPRYSGVLLEQHLLLNRRNRVTDEYQRNQRELAEKSCVYICTTMYHEIEQEMEQLLKSVHEIDCARAISMRQIESHIFFDGAIKGDVLNNYVLQLVSLIPKTLKVNIDACMKMKTPYGMQMRWRLPGGMFFIIHLKDNLRVKNKKRWSQVMYMSYVLDFKERQMEVTDKNTYILTTDADVKFTHGSVEALLHLMMRDPTVGAACGRTHPLGIGPMVWYQIFDYAIGHWFQKVANHVLGSVLCSPGCFSVYRAAALRDVLPIYSTGVDNSFDFLTKDMGEDRWLCTLMVQSGWKLEYCAAAEDSTYCPDSFDEFFKQRRRWIPSTIANLVLLISQWRLTVDNNDFISFPFILYQMLIVFSTLISPATVILVMVGGLKYADMGLSSEIVNVLLLVGVAIGFALICLYTSSEFQLKAAKLFSVVFALLMAYVAVGVAAQAADDLYEREHKPRPTTPTTPPGNHTNSSFNFWLDPTLSLSTTTEATLADKLPADVSSLYLGGLIGIFFLAAFLHPSEMTCLIHGFWYLFCLPAGYLFLIVYSTCNMTDRSWGTREEKTKSVDDVPWYHTLWAKMKYALTCCRSEPAPQVPAAAARTDMAQPAEQPGSSQEESSDSSPTSEDEKQSKPLPEEKSEGENEPSTSHTTDDTLAKPSPPPPPKSAMKLALSRPRRMMSQDTEREESERLTRWRYPGDKKVTFASKLPKLHAETPVEEWLHGDFKERYSDLFKVHGYDNVSFIAGMTDRDLKAIGIETRGHRKKLLLAIEKLPILEIPQEVPENVEDWLTDLGLDEYWANFEQSGYTEPKMLEDLKVMNKETLRADLKISKQGHLNKLYKAIQRVQYPSEAQRRIRRAREDTNKIITLDLKKNNEDQGLEYRFWEGLREACLMPESAVFGAVSELKEKLEELRDAALMCLLIVNLLWIILIMTLVKQEHLKVLGTNVLGLAFLCVYGFIIVIQFLTMLWHRGVTFLHVIARAPWKRGPMHMAWAFDNEHLPPPPTDSDLEDIRSRRGRKHRKRTLRRYFSQGASDDSQRLLCDGNSSTDYGSRDKSLPHLV